MLIIMKELLNSSNRFLDGLIYIYELSVRENIDEKSYYYLLNNIFFVKHWKKSKEKEIQDFSTCFTLKDNVGANYETPNEN